MNLRGRNKISPEFNMSSMTDVVFLLLIFFMIASTLAKQLNTIKVKLPEAEGKSENRNAVAVTITNSKKFNIWWGEFYFQKQEWTERKEQGGFVQWRKELRHG